MGRTLSTEKNIAFSRAAHAAQEWMRSNDGYNSKAYREYRRSYADLEAQGWLEEFKAWFRAIRISY